MSDLVSCCIFVLDWSEQPTNHCSRAYSWSHSVLGWRLQRQTPADCRWRTLWSAQVRGGGVSPSWPGHHGSHWNPWQSKIIVFGLIWFSSWCTNMSMFHNFYSLLLQGQQQDRYEIRTVQFVSYRKSYPTPAPPLISLSLAISLDPAEHWRWKCTESPTSSGVHGWRRERGRKTYCQSSNWSPKTWTSGQTSLWVGRCSSEHGHNEWDPERGRAWQGESRWHTTLGCEYIITALVSLVVKGFLFHFRISIECYTTCKLV